MTCERPRLRELARRLGIHSGYRDVYGRERETSAATYEALVAAQGFDGADEAAAERAIASLDRERRARLVEPVLVWREWEHAAPALGLHPAALEGARDYRLELRLENGDRHRVEAALPDATEPVRSGAVAHVPLPVLPPAGYHEIRIEIDGPGITREAAQRLVMAPRTAWAPEESIGPGPAFGLWANLYSVRSERNPGHGNLGDLRALGRFAGETGASFVGINPLHAVPNCGLGFAPYSPSSRLYRNVMYLELEAVPELADCEAARARMASADWQARRGALAARDRIDHEGVLDLILPVLRDLHAAFRRRHASEATPRGRAYAEFRAREGRSLRDFATWEALAEGFAEPGGPPATEWWRWPEAFRDPDSAAVAAFRDRREQDVDFRSWLQFELERQLARTARHVREAGCGLGIYQDLALGSSRASADAWMAPGLFASGVHVGAPPDDYAPHGQDWGFPPLDPRRLRQDGYRAWSRVLDAALRHSGALRLDHAMGLLRLFWIPAGRTGEEGAYVSYRAEELLGVLALESRRHAAVVVAEDLGTVPAELPGLLGDWGLLRSTVVSFERDASGAYRPAERYPSRALATLGTHDLAPLAGFWSGADLDLRRELDLPAPDGDWQVARARREADRRAWVERLRADGHLPDEGESLPDADSVLEAAHRLLASAPSVLVGVSLDDLAREEEPVNLPGVPRARHPSWCRRMRRPLEELAGAPDVARALAPLSGRSRQPGKTG